MIAEMNDWMGYLAPRLTGVLGRMHPRFRVSKTRDFVVHYSQGWLWTYAVKGRHLARSP